MHEATTTDTSEQATMSVTIARRGARGASPSHGPIRRLKDLTSAVGESDWSSNPCCGRQAPTALAREG